MTTQGETVSSTESTPTSTPKKAAAKSAPAPEAAPTFSMDGARVLVVGEDEDGNPTTESRAATIGEQVEHMKDQLLQLVVGSVPTAFAGKVEADGGEDEATLTITLGIDPDQFKEEPAA